MSATLDQIAQRLSAIAAQSGLRHIVILVEDPMTREQKLYASDGALDRLRGIAAQKFHLMDAAESESLAGWPSDF